jgi:hypothetical protein
MAEKHDLNVTIGPTGEIEIKVEGVKGAKCIDLTEFLETDLGEIISKEKTSEYYDKTKNDGNIRNYK